MTFSLLEAQNSTLEPTDTIVALGSTQQLNAKISPDDTVVYAYDRTVVWTSGDETVATVDANGVVRGVALGTATITVTAANGKKAKVKIKVK